MFMNRRILILFICLGIILTSFLLVYFLFKPKTVFISPNSLLKLEPLILDIKPISSEILFEEKDEVSLLFVGDIMLDRSVWLKTLQAEDYYHPFKNLDYFNNYDFRVGNLEGPITNFKSIANGQGNNRLVFTFSKNFLEPLAQYFEVLNLANNHTYNFGEVGLKETHNFLDEYNILYFGDPNNKKDFSIILEKNNLKIGLVGYHELIGYGFENLLMEIEKIKPEVDYLIVLPHWGIEYQTEKPSLKQITEAHKIIEVGGDLIIGSHPHVIQPLEEYEGKLIFYSLGNFIFDQYFSQETQQGLNIEVYLKKEYNKLKVKLGFLPIEINALSQPNLAKQELEKNILISLAELSNVSTSTKRAILRGNLEIE